MAYEPTKLVNRETNTGSMVILKMTVMIAPFHFHRARGGPCGREFVVNHGTQSSVETQKPHHVIGLSIKASLSCKHTHILPGSTSSVPLPPSSAQPSILHATSGFQTLPLLLLRSLENGVIQQCGPGVSRLRMD